MGPAWYQVSYLQAALLTVRLQKLILKLGVYHIIYCKMTLTKVLIKSSNIGEWLDKWLPLQRVVQDIVYPTSVCKEYFRKTLPFDLWWYGSHITSDVVETAAANNIHLFCLPPHMMHRLQPLDVGVFGPVQKAWMKRCEQYSVWTGEGMWQCDVVKEYMEAHKELFTGNTILQAWQKSGIKPLDPGIFNDDDYAPSNSTSTLDQLPLSFPTHLPSDWDIPSSKDPDFDPSAQQPTSHSNVKPLPDLDFDSESSTSESADLELNPNISNDSDSNDSEMDIDKWWLSISEQPSE